MLLSSCNYNDVDGIPAYITVDTTYFNVNYPSIQGSSSHNISEVWVYVDNTIQGVYDIPVTFPIIASGATAIKMRAGIKINGVSGQWIYYPFYDICDFGDVNLTRGEITTLNPTFTYSSAADFVWIEDYENMSTSLTKYANSDTTITILNKNEGDVFEGFFCGKIVLEDDRTYFAIANADGFADLPVDGSAVYLELNYKIDTVMCVGAIAQYDSGTDIQYPIVYLKATNTWKKIYVNITTALTNYYAAEHFAIYFSGGSSSLETIGKKEFCIDNIKLLY